MKAKEESHGIDILGSKKARERDLDSNMPHYALSTYNES